MITKFIIKRRQSNDAWDVKDLVHSVKWTTDIDFSAGQLDFEIAEKDDGFAIRNGDVVFFDWDGKQIFKGFVFKFDFKKGAKYSVTAYDAMRYFKSSDSIVFSVSTLAQRFTRICKYLGVPHRVIKAPKHKLISEVDDNKSYFNMLQSSIQQIYNATGERYFLRDNYGVIELRQYPYMQLDMIVGDQSMLTDYTFSQSIEQTANVVKVAKSSTTIGQKKISTEQAQGKSVGKWGKLVYMTQSTKKLNDAQLRKLAQQELKNRNQQQTKLSITAIGNTDLQAGNSVIINIKELRDIHVGAKRYLIKKAVHTFGSDYTVDLEMGL